MGKLHEILAVEKTKTNVANKLLAETQHKFGKIEYFQGHVKSLKMLEDTPQNQAIETAARDERELPTTVAETLKYVFKSWADAEDVIFQKNLSNQYAVADIMFDGSVLVENVPVDELMGLEARLDTLRKVVANMPTLPAAIKFEPDTESGRLGARIATNPEVTVKGEKVTTAVVLYEATDKHPAQVEKVSNDKVVGYYTQTKLSGAASSAEKASMLDTIDKLIAEIKQARMRANSVEASTRKIGNIITDLLMKSFK